MRATARPGEPSSQPPLVAPATAASTKRLLLADDDEAYSRSVHRVLSRSGWEVVTVSDGNAAVDALMNLGPFDVILTDIHMPGTSGVDVLRIVRAYDLDVPVILVTGDPGLDSAVAALELGALRYLTKPCEADELRGAVERAANLHRLARVKREALLLAGGLANEAGDRAGLIAGFERALASMWIAYQPIVSVRGHRVVAYEALLRVEEPSMPDPMSVIEAAERLKRIPEMGQRVRGLVAQVFAADLPSEALLFVNVHPLELLDPSLVSKDSPLSAFAERVVLEITERAALDVVPDLERRVSILRYMGYRLAIDDLGAGHAGLSSFARLEPEFVKLDQSLVCGVHTSTVRQRLVGSVISLCDQMRMTAIVEGVEEANDRRTLIELGCDLMQGYLYARPERTFSEPRWPV